MRRIGIVLLLALQTALYAASALEGYRLWQAQRAAKEGDFTRALQIYRQIKPQNDRLRYNEANLLYRLGKYRAALALYRRILEPSLQGFRLYNMANCYVRLGDYPRARIYYEAAAKFLPADPELRYNLTKIKARLRQQALEDALLMKQKGQKKLCKLERLPYGVRRGFYQGKSFADDFESNQTLYEARFGDLLLKQANIATAHAPKNDASAEELGAEAKRTAIGSSRGQAEGLERQYYERKLKQKSFRSLLIPLSPPKEKRDENDR
ncbi:tetratricopeptide repeat protein [Nitratifractor salsuginis]|uniref:Tetratricopeptide TPR_1 repeat-containing protein n=1 Tax=Nitratifractor salsuginis (strain DSM 16511 / JCM 12458 / E9I37-1) TaxID=749222 RepID=E6X2M8_NITSE|nr:tetratricopeptide repeat protein [Nitratifractor salsuginis]ADV46094.1 Tetratricopeptide TPR_1 repeat-containing protein [Nitratifractor salsuginis DSM 16511]